MGINVAGPAQRPRSEAAELVGRLEAGGMKRAEIAKRIGERADVLRNITRGKSTGLRQLDKLRGLQRYAAPASHSAATQADTLDPTLDDDAGAADDTAGAGEAVVSVAARPADDRNAAARAKDAVLAFMLGGAETVATAKPKKARAADDDALEQILPLAAMLSVLAVRLSLRPPYKPVAPTTDEAEAIIRPILRMALRQLEVTGRLSENVVDLLAAMAAAAIYAQRASETIDEIRRAEEARIVEANQEGVITASAAGAGGRGSGGRAAPPAPAHAYAGNPPTAPAQPGRAGIFGRGRAPVVSAAAAAGNGHQAGGENNQQATGQAADIFDALYAADAAGRRQQGLN